MDIDLETDPFGTDENEDPVYLADIWPDADEIHTASTRAWALRCSRVTTRQRVVYPGHYEERRW